MNGERTTPQAAIDLDRHHVLHLLHEMVRIRRFEAKCAELYGTMKIRGFLHLYDGEEAVAVGVMQALTPQDAIVAMNKAVIVDKKAPAAVAKAFLKANKLT